MRISDWSSDVCSSDLPPPGRKCRSAARRGAEDSGRDRPGPQLSRRTPAKVDIAYDEIYSLSCKSQFRTHSPETQSRKSEASAWKRRSNRPLNARRSTSEIGRAHV